MKTWTEQMILDLIESADNVVLFKMLHSLYERQTAYEQSAEYTKDRNDVGFNAYDAKFLSSVAKNAEQYGRVSNGQAPHIRKALKKYRKQLVDIANVNESKRNGMSPVVAVPFGKNDDDARDKKPWAGQFEKNFVAAVDREIDSVSAVVTQVMEKQQAVQIPLPEGDLYAKSWDEVFKQCQHEWGEYTMQDVAALEARWHRKYNFVPGSPMRGCHNMVCTKCGEYQFIDSSD